MFRFLTEEINNSEKSAVRIAQIEQKYGIAFPQILRELYAKMDGSYMKMCEIERSGFILLTLKMLTSRC